MHFTGVPVAHDPSILLSLLPTRETAEKKWAVGKIIDSLVELIVCDEGILSPSIAAALLLVLETEHFDIALCKVQDFIFSTSEDGAEYQRGESFGLFLESALYYFSRNSNISEKVFSVGETDVLIENDLSNRYEMVLSYAKGFIERKLSCTEPNYAPIDSKDAFYTAIQSRTLEKFLISLLKDKSIKERSDIAKHLTHRASSEELETLITKGIVARWFEDAEEGNGVKKVFLRAIRTCLSSESQEVRTLITKFFDKHFAQRPTDAMKLEHDGREVCVNQQSSFSPLGQLKLALRYASDRESFALSLLLVLNDLLKERQSKGLEKDQKLFQFALSLCEILLQSEMKMEYRCTIRMFVDEFDIYLSEGAKASQKEKNRVHLLTTSVEEMMHTRSWYEIMEDSLFFSGSIGMTTRYYSDDGILMQRIPGDKFSPEEYSSYVSILLSEAYGKRKTPYTLGVPSITTSWKFLSSYGEIIDEEELLPPKSIEILSEIFSEDGEHLTKQFIQTNQTLKDAELLSPTTDSTLRLIKERDVCSVGIFVLTDDGSHDIDVVTRQVKVKLKNENEFSLRDKKVLTEGSMVHFQRVIVLVPEDFPKDKLEEILSKKRDSAVMGHESVLFLVPEKLFDQVIERQNVYTMTRVEI